MTARPVQAAFFWRYGKAAFKPVYGRIGDGYTKDYLQSPSGQRPTLDAVLGEPNPKIPVEYRWPGGSRQGEWRTAANDERGQLAWVTADGAPIPWKVGNVTTDKHATIPGDPSKTVPSAADAEFDALEAQNLDPWIVAVKLRDEESILHARAYLGNPPSGLEARGLDTLPAPLRAAIKALPANSGGGAYEFKAGATLRAPELVANILRALDDGPNVLVVGPPGTGKTVALEDLRGLFESGVTQVLFDPQTWEGSWTTTQALPPASERKCRSLVFHPSYSYEDFVAGLVPQSITGGGFKLVARPGPLLSLSHWASDKDRHALLIIDEFNRGPAAAIFGDTLALLDGQKRFDPNDPTSGAVIQRPFPTDLMEVEASFARKNGSKEPSVEMKIPKQLWIVAALNSTDRSVAPIDAALRRRFSILRAMPDYAVLAERLGATLGVQPASTNPGTWTDQEVRQLALSILETLNKRISFVLGEDFLLGHALLWTVQGTSKDELAIALGRAFDQRIAATLRMTFADQDEPLAGILNAGEQPVGGGASNSANNWLARWNSPPASLQSVATPRLEIRELASLSPEEILSALQTLL